MSRYVRCALWHACLLCCWTSPVWAVTLPAPEPPHPVGMLTLGDAVAAALRGHPELEVMAWERRAAEARRLQAGLRPNPELIATLENGPGTGEHSGLSLLETTIQLALPLEPGARRDARLGISGAELAGVDAREVLLRLDVAASTSRMFIDVVEQQQNLKLAAQAAQDAEAMLEAARRRVRAGAASELEISRAVVALERARLQQEHYEHLLLVQRRLLAAQWGEHEPAFEQADADLLPLPALPDGPALLAQLRLSPDFALYDVESRLHQAQAAHAVAQNRMQPLVGIGVRRFEATDDVALLATLTLPLPWLNRQQGAIAEAEALSARSTAARAAAELTAEAALFDLLQELKHAATVLERLDAELIPQAERALRLLRQGYESGRYTQLDWLDARRTRLELEQERLSTAAEFHRFRVAVERMTALSAP